MSNGKLFLAIRAEIRKKIKKQDGNVVHVILYPDNESLEIPEEFTTCLKDEPAAEKFSKAYQKVNRSFILDGSTRQRKRKQRLAG